MSAIIARYRILGTVLILALGTILAGCTGYEDDPGAKRTQQQSDELRDRIHTIQIDR